MQDSRGLTLTAESSDAVGAYEGAISSFLNYDSVAGSLVKSTVADYPELAMATILRGYMTLMIESSAVQGKVQQIAEHLLANPDRLNKREQNHAKALQQWAMGNPAGAALVWDQVLAATPHDLLALKMHHYTTFWRGRPAALRSTVESVLPFWDETTPGYDHVLGMHAFALNETGRYEEAESIGRAAVEQNPEDLWSVHSVAHALEMRGDITGGVDWFRERLDTWGSKNPFRGHLWWHAILFPYAAGNYEEVLRLYDTGLAPLSTDFFLDIQNRASILARLELANIEVGDRWDELAEFAIGRTGDHVLAFTDLHCCLALASTGHSQELARFVDSMTAHRASLQTNGYDAAGYEVAVTLARGIELWVSGDGATAVDQLWALRDELLPIGGSHAQQSLFGQLITRIISEFDGQRAASLLASGYSAFPSHAATIDSFLAVLESIEPMNRTQRALIESTKSSREILNQLETTYFSAQIE